MPPPGLTFGQAAKSGVTRKAVRVYGGLPPAAERTEAGYRLYGQHNHELLTFIRRARALGLHLDDICDVLAIRNGGTPPCATVRCLRWLMPCDSKSGFPCQAPRPHAGQRQIHVKEGLVQRSHQTEGHRAVHQGVWHSAPRKAPTIKGYRLSRLMS